MGEGGVYMDVCETMKFYEHHRGSRRVEHMRSPLGPLKPSFHCVHKVFMAGLLLPDSFL